MIYLLKCDILYLPIIKNCGVNELKKQMITITACLFVAFAILLPVFIATKNAVVEVITISVGVTLYHFAMRLAVGTVVNLVMKNKANYKNLWFSEKGFEKKLYKLIQVKKWKKHIPTYDPNTFDTSKKTVNEIIGATCQAEVVHEIIMLLSLLPIALTPLLGGTAVFIITSVLAMIIDCVFVILQRYNRPKLIKVMQRFDKIKSKEVMQMNCVFCRIIKGELNSFKIYEDEHTLVFMDIAKDVDGHMLAIPKKHVKSILDCDNECLNHLMATVKKVCNHLVDNCGYDGVNLLNASDESAGQSVPHFHVHIIPRKNNDGIDTWPKFNGATEEIEELFNKLKMQ